MITKHHTDRWTIPITQWRETESVDDQPTCGRFVQEHRRLDSMESDFTNNKQKQPPRPATVDDNPDVARATSK